MTIPCIAEEHDGVVCKFYDGGVVKVGTTAADRFTIRLKDGEDFPTRLKKELEERSAREPEHEGRQLYRKRPTAAEELQGISAKNQKIYDERLAARQAATQRNAEDRHAARTAVPVHQGGRYGAAAAQSHQQTRDAQKVAKKVSTLDGWLGGTDGCNSQYGRF